MNNSKFCFFIESHYKNHMRCISQDGAPDLHMYIVLSFQMVLLLAWSILEDKLLAFSLSFLTFRTLKSQQNELTFDSFRKPQFVPLPELSFALQKVQSHLLKSRLERTLQSR